MDAGLDLLLIAVFCTADDLLPKRAENARRMVTDAEVITIAVGQQLLGINSDEQFCAGAPRRLGICSRPRPNDRATSSAVSAWPTPSRR